MGSLILMLGLNSARAEEKARASSAPSFTKDSNLGLIAKRSPNLLKDSYFASRHLKDPPRNAFFVPFFSIILPGLGQYIEGQVQEGAIYTGLALAGSAYAGFNGAKVEEFQESTEYQTMTDAEKENRNTHGEYERKFGVGSQLQFAAGSFSAYHSFRSRALSHQRVGGYKFLTKEETPTDLLLAPFDFKYLKRSSTYIPLAIVAGLSLISRPTDSEDEEYETDSLSNSDIAFSLVSSYGAGTHEEVLFRGWVMPLLHEQMNSPVWSNVVTSILFAAAHLGSISVPLPQLLLGYHLGNETQDNQWTLAEAIFIHTWWDVIAFTSIYQYKKREPGAAITPVLWLPPFEMTF